MANIKGCTFKNFKTYRGHEGESCMQASLYLDGKKIAFVNEDTWSGEYETTFTNDDVEKEFNKRVDAYFKEHPCDVAGPTIFLYELRLLFEKEKEFKKYEKYLEKFNKPVKKYSTLQVVFLWKGREVGESCIVAEDPDMLEKVKKEQKPKYDEIVFHRSLDDFNVL